MKRGASGLDLTVVFDFTDDGDAELSAVTLGELELPKKLAQRLLEALPRDVQDKLAEDAWEDADYEEELDRRRQQQREKGAA